MEVVGKPKTGGEYGQLRNRALLQKVSEKLTIIEIPKIGLFRHAINLLTGKSYGYTSNLIKKIDLQLAHEYDYVFFDSSVYGYLVKYVKMKGFNTIVFFHNVEYEFYKAKYQSQKNFMNYVLIYYTKQQEHLSIQYADKTVTLNERDSKGLLETYGRKSDFVSPIFYRKLTKESLAHNCGTNIKYLLFVGANFCANNDGMEWFIKQVCPYINVNIYVAGSCCKVLESKIDISKYPNVKLLGFVDDLDGLYKNAVGVICPIFAGSGMKTKTIEAMMYGKTIFGTTEAFEGIHVEGDKIGKICNTKEDFIKTINGFDLKPFNEYSYEMFCAYFSEDVVVPKFKTFIETK